MKIVVIADSHGNLANLKHVMGFAKKIKAEAIVHCGDWNTLESVETVLSFGIPLYSVLGNADIDERIANRLQCTGKKHFDKDYLKLKIGGRKIGVIHDIKKVEIKDLDLGIIFCGHRHYKNKKFINGVNIIYPGALHSIKPSFVIYETDTNKVEFIDG